MSKKKDDEIRDVEPVVELMDEEGNAYAFELLDIVDCEGKEYAVLFPCDDPESEEVLICEYTDDPDDPEQEMYLPVDDEALINRVYEIFKRMNADNYNFLD